MLKNSEELVSKYQFLSRTSMDGFWIFDRTGRILFANPSLCRMHGYGPEELAGKRLQEFEAAEDEPAVRSHLARIVEHGPDRFESLMHHKDGTLLDIEVSVSFIPEDEIFLAFTRDITSRKKAERTLQESEARFRNLFDHNMDGVLLTQPDGQIYAANQEACAIFGMSEGEICRVGRTGLVDQIDPRLMAALNERDAQGRVRAEYQHIRKGADSFSAEISSVIPRDHKGSFVIIRDITERERLEKSLREHELFIHATIDGISAHLCVIDSQGKIVITNRSWKMFAEENGADAETCGEGANYLDTCRAASEAGTAESLAIASGITAVLDGKLPDFVMEYCCHGPEVNRWFLGRVNPFSISGENYAVISHVDITELKKIEEEVSALNCGLEQRINERTAELEASIREQEAFSYSISHDLRAPLRHINSFSAMLTEDYGPVLPEEARNYLDRIRGATRDLGCLIDHLLELSRVGRTALKKESVDLSALAQSVATMLRETEPLRRVEFSIEEGVRVNGDTMLLRLVLENLFGNAWKFCAERRVMRVEFGRTYANGEPVLFVKDNGAGFDMAYIGNLFKIFQRLHGAEFEGTGIGLAIAQRIIKRHGGRIWAEGRVDAGATFYFTLPSVAAGVTLREHLIGL